MKSIAVRRSPIGMTLVELLIVMSIMVLLAAIALPSFKTVVESKKTSQSALVAKSFLEAARIKAISKGRDVAVVLERLSNLTSDGVSVNQCIRMSLAEVLAPYRGDIESSKVDLSVLDDNFESNRINGIPDRYRQDGTSWWDGIATVNKGVIYLDQNPSASYFVNIGDQIAFNDSNQRFEIIYVAPNTITNTIEFHFGNCMKVDLDSRTGVEYVEWSHNLPDMPIAKLSEGPHRFAIYSRPRRLFSKPMVLPKGSCIDLSLSGSGRSGTELCPKPGNNSATPVYLVFSPNGGLSAQFYGFDAVASRKVSLDDVYLFVGRFEQVVNPYNPAAATSDRDDFKPNLNDSSCFWIRINPDSGQISTASNSDPLSHDVTEPVKQIIHARGFATAGIDGSAL
jgi:prepilin-type N-terminal cleavage/methylation domain-containing protein